LRDAVRRFAAERDWEQFHSPKNLSMGLAVEAGELMEHFLWMEGEASRQIKLDVNRLGQVADEWPTWPSICSTWPTPGHRPQ